MEIVIIKARSDEARDRMWVTRSDGSSAQVPIKPAHDLPHLVVESVFGIEHGFWGLLAAGAFAEDIHASHARTPERAKGGRIGVLVARPHQSPVAEDALLARHMDELLAAKAITNTFRPWGVPDRRPQKVRQRLAGAAEANPIVRDVLERLTDDLVEHVFDQQDELWRRWTLVEPGEQLRLSWPLTDSLMPSAR